MGFSDFDKSTPSTKTASEDTTSEGAISRGPFARDLASQDVVSQDTVSKQDIVAFYERLRPIRTRLNNELVRRFPSGVLEEGGQKLGILRNGTFVFDSEDDTCVLMDYCVYDVYRNGRNAVEQYLYDYPPDADSDPDEMACLHAMQRATYAVLVVLEVEAGVGCYVRNAITDETRLLVDMGFSMTAEPGALMATRLLDFGQFVATGGAALPMGGVDSADLDELQRNVRAAVGDVSRFDPAILIRECLQIGASSHVRYQHANTGHRLDYAEAFPPMRHSPKERRALAKRRSTKPASNRRCRCGSGKMFKNCCGKR